MEAAAFVGGHLPTVRCRGGHQLVTLDKAVKLFYQAVDNEVRLVGHRRTMLFLTFSFIIGKPYQIALFNSFVGVSAKLPIIIIYATNPTALANRTVAIEEAIWEGLVAHRTVLSRDAHVN